MARAVDGAAFESVRYRHYVGHEFILIRTESFLTAIVILALVALFIGLRLYAVLGERTGHEQPILKPADPDARIEQPVHAAPREAAKATDSGDLAYLPLAGPGVRALLAADPSFDVARFLEGAAAAYRMILENFWKGDLDAIKPHVAPHVFETFAGAVDQRAKDGHKLDNRLVALEPAVITDASVDK